MVYVQNLVAQMCVAASQTKIKTALFQTETMAGIDVSVRNPVGFSHGYLREECTFSMCFGSSVSLKNFKHRRRGVGKIMQPLLLRCERLKGAYICPVKGKHRHCEGSWRSWELGNGYTKDSAERQMGSGTGHIGSVGRTIRHF